MTSLISKPSAIQCFEICKWCMNYLLENGAQEKGLFRTSPSINDIRRMKTYLIDGILKSIYSVA